MHQVNTKNIPILLDDKRAPNRYSSSAMANEIARTVRLPERLWNALDRDAVDCKRSAVKQLEAVLSAYYLGETSSLKLDKLDELKPTKGLLSTNIKLAKTDAAEKVKPDKKTRK